MANSNSKGDRRERELVNLLDKIGFEVMRAPSSGSATDRNLPDVLAGDGEWFYAIECKSSSGQPIYLDDDEVASLEAFATAFGAEPLIGVRFDYDDWAFLPPRECYRTESGNYRIKQELATSHGREIGELGRQGLLKDWGGSEADA